MNFLFWVNMAVMILLWSSSGIRYIDVLFIVKRNIFVLRHFFVVIVFSCARYCVWLCVYSFESITKKNLCLRVLK